MALISFITVTRNRKDDLRRALASIRMQDYPEKEILVADNASDDGTREMVAQEFPEVKLIALKENQGAVGGRNRAIEQARGDIIVFIDDDVELVDKGAARKAVDYFTTYPDAGALTFFFVSPVTQMPDTKLIPRKDKRLKKGECCMFLGGGSAFRRKVFLDIGLFWERLSPLAGEEVDFSYRMINAGYKILWVQDIKALHHESKAERPSWRRIYYIARNRPWIVMRHLPLHYAVVSIGVWWSYLLVQSLKNGAIVWWVKGVAASLKGMPGVWKERRPIAPETVRYYRKHSGSLWW